jgi:hypothetical protein
VADIREYRVRRWARQCPLNETKPGVVFSKAKAFQGFTHDANVAAAAGAPVLALALAVPVHAQSFVGDTGSSGNVRPLRRDWRALYLRTSRTSMGLKTSWVMEGRPAAPRGVHEPWRHRARCRALDGWNQHAHPGAQNGVT